MHDDAARRCHLCDERSALSFEAPGHLIVCADCAQRIAQAVFSAPKKRLSAIFDLEGPPYSLHRPTANADPSPEAPLLDPDAKRDFWLSPDPRELASDLSVGAALAKLSRLERGKAMLDVAKVFIVEQPADALVIAAQVLEQPWAAPLFPEALALVFHKELARRQTVERLRRHLYGH